MNTVVVVDPHHRVVQFPNQGWPARNEQLHFDVFTVIFVAKIIGHVNPDFSFKIIGPVIQHARRQQIIPTKLWPTVKYRVQRTSFPHVLGHTDRGDVGHPVPDRQRLPQIIAVSQHIDFHVGCTFVAALLHGKLTVGNGHVLEFNVVGMNAATVGVLGCRHD